MLYYRYGSHCACLIERLQTPQKMSRNFIDFPRDVPLMRTFMVLHCDVVLHVIMALDSIFSTFFPVLHFFMELECYACLTMGWAASVYNESSTILMQYTLILAAQNFLICFVDENLLSSFDDFTTSLCNLNLHLLQPTDRTAIYFLIMKRPPKLKVGPFHDATVYATFLRRWSHRSQQCSTDLM